MPFISTGSLGPTEVPPSARQVYNGLDCCLTLEIWEELQGLFNQPPEIYSFERAMQAPALEMMLRGFRIDEGARRAGTASLRADLTALDSILQEYAFAVWGKPVNPRSPEQLKVFFYETMNLPQQFTYSQGKKRVSVNREALEKLEIYFHARPIIACILAIRDTGKRLNVLETEVDPDGRMRTSYNIAGTETGRWSSSKSSTKTGTNLQSITSSLRNIFVSDPGYKLCGIDLEQAESREVGWLCGVLFNDWSYLDAAESGDLHTLTCKLIWPDRKWPGDSKGDRALADQLFYRDFSYRDMSKRGGHGSNYLGTPFTMSRHLKVPTKLMVDFQHAYFSAFPAIPRYHRWTAQQLQTVQKITTSFGRQRHFFGRPNDDTTLREAVAYSPQSSTGDRLNLVVWRIWKQMKNVQLLAQLHDAVYFQYREDADEAAIIEQALKLTQVHLSHPARSAGFVIPGEVKIGWNWGSFGPNNPDGLTKWKGSDSRTRTPLLETTF